MIHVYCLINPLTGKPFYVGVTMGKPGVRLSSHISEIKMYSWCRNDKQRLIAHIIDNGRKPECRALITVETLQAAEYYELFFYYLLKYKHNYDLLQKLPSGYASYIKNCGNYSRNRISMQHLSKSRTIEKPVIHLVIFFFQNIAKNIW